MGYYTTIMIGPFIKIKTIKVPYEKKIRSCVEHGANTGGLYCSQCGKELKEHTLIKYWNANIEDILGCDELRPYINNNGYTYLFCYDLGMKSPEYNEMTKITSSELNNQVQKFKIKHSTNIKILEKKIGEKIKVEFGVFYDYS